MSHKEQHIDPLPELLNGSEPIYVTSPSLPALSDLIPLLEDIWERKYLTNFGEYHNRFENALKEFFGTPYVSLVSNATLGLMIALRALDVKGKILTTPFSFVATAHSIVWNGLDPVFCDIEPETLNIDPKAVEANITSETGAIMPVHVFGNPCKLDQLRSIAARYELPLIYDAAHAFGVKIEGKSLCVNGDISVVSFHATKAFNTIEGGVVISSNAETKQKVDLLRNFGFTGEITVEDIGINAKMNEVQAAFGLLMLDRWSSIQKNRARVFHWYTEDLMHIEGVTLLHDPKLHWNYSYVPILVTDGFRDVVYEGLKKLGYHSRRYFYPLITDFKAYRIPDSETVFPFAARASRNILCLPISEYLRETDVRKICRAITKLAAG